MAVSVMISGLRVASALSGGGGVPGVEWSAVGAVLGVVALMLIRPAPGSGLRARSLPRLSGWRRRLAELRRDTKGEVRRDAAMLLRQFSALLQSGRGETQAWSDLRDHWERRRPGHPFVRCCAQVAASEQMGMGSAAGLQRSLEQLGDSQEERETAMLLERLVSITALSEQTGAPLSRLVEQVAAAMDDASELHASVRAAAAGPKLTQMILALLPLGGLALGQLMGVDVVGILLGSGLGLVSLLLGTALLAAGHWWSSRLISAVVRHV